jgi:hypothetical protein
MVRRYPQPPVGGGLSSRVTSHEKGRTLQIYRPVHLSEEAQVVYSEMRQRLLGAYRDAGMDTVHVTEPDKLRLNLTKVFKVDGLRHALGNPTGSDRWVVGQIQDRLQRRNATDLETLEAINNVRPYVVSRRRRQWAALAVADPRVVTERSHLEDILTPSLKTSLAELALVRIAEATVTTDSIPPPLTQAVGRLVGCVAQQISFGLDPVEYDIREARRQQRL